MEEENQIKQAHDQVSPAVQTGTRGTSLAIPVSIVVGFALVAGAIYFSGANSQAQQGTQNAANVLGVEEPTTGEIRPVDEKDHIRGNPNAPIVMIEYSDYDCPFCKNYHETMKRVIQNYGADGKVAWVYRHFPLEQLHPSAPHIALASECVAELGGNDAFWKFTDLVFGERGTNEPTNTARLPEFAKTAGVSESAFTACVEEGRTKSLVDEDMRDAIAAGGKGTPHTLVLVGGQQGIISGAQPYETVSKILDTLIAQMENQES